MKYNLLFATLALSCSTALVGCGGDDGDDINITINENVDGGDGDNPRTGDCALVTEASFVSFNNDCSVGTLSGLIDQDYTLISEVEWLLSGEVLVGEGNIEVRSDADVQAVKAAGVTLEIEPGTEVKAFDDGSLLVTRGSRLVADGTPSAPITFSSIDTGYDGIGEWGGVIIQGFAPQYGQRGAGPCFGSGTTCNVAGEGGTVVGNFGGNDDADDSGVLRYVRIAEGGRIAGPNNEINGLTLQGVGHGTTLEYIQVHGNLDDGVEWFGGTVNAKYLVLTNNDDDDIDYDEGYQGNIQYALVQKDPNKAGPTGSNDPRGIEANSSDADYVPETNAVIANVTIVGSEVNKALNSGDEGNQPGMRLRGAVTTSVYNSAVDNFSDCIRIDDADTNNDKVVEEFSTVNLTNIAGSCDDDFYAKRNADSETNIFPNETFVFSNTYAITDAFAQLGANTIIDAVDNGSDFIFDETDYIGAVDPKSSQAWWEGWIIPGSLNPATPEDTSFVSCSVVNAEIICALSGVINQDYTLSRGITWVLDGEVLVGEGNIALSSQADVDAVRAAGVTLTIHPGVHVRAEADGSLLVTRGSRLEAVGTAASPITFSSFDDEDLDGEGEWGGVILQGFAPQYAQGGGGACFGTGSVCNVDGEGGTIVGRFGGNDPADNSGTLRYVRIAEGGRIAGPNNEINGLTLQGVGHGTTLEYIQVHGNLDDGIEWFGGTVNAKYLVLTNNDDDDIDYDEGYQGNIQYAIVRKNPSKSGPTGSNDPRGIEANSSDAAYVPETNASLSNILIIGSEVNKAVNSRGDADQPGMRLRGALTTNVYNTAVDNFSDCVRIDDADTDDNDTTGDANGNEAFSTVGLTNVLGQCDDDFYARRAANSEAGTVGASTLTIDGAYALTDTAASVTEVNPVEVNNGSGFVFDNTDYVGAVAPGTAAEDAWWAGWVIEGSL